MGLTDDLVTLESATHALLTDAKAAASTKRFGAAVLAAVNDLAGKATAPPAGGLGVYALGGSLASFTHLDDSTYSTVIGDWSDAPLLSGCHGTSYAYAVVADTPGANPNLYNVLDPTGKAQSVSTFIERCKLLVTLHPGLDGIFIDNLVPGRTGLSEALIQVSDALRPAVKIAANVGGFISGQSGSDDGSVWLSWMAATFPYLDRIMLENWMTPSDQQPPVKVRLRGTAWDQNYDGWLRCVQAAAGKLFAVTYGPESFGVYGRAAMILAAGADNGNCFYNAPGGTGPDQYGKRWQASPTAPTIDPTTGTATL